MAASEYARGHNITVKPVPREMMYFSLAKEFHWLPDEINRQDPKIMKGIIYILSVCSNVQSNMANNADSASNSKKTFSKGGKQYVNITDPEVEKSLAEGNYKL